MTPFQAQCTRHIRHMKVVTPNLGQQHFPFKRFGPLSERSRRFSSRGANKSLRHAAARARQNHPDIRAAHRSFSRQQHQPRPHFGASRSVAAPRSHRRRKSSLSTRSAPPLAAQSAPLAPENPPAARAAAAAPAEKHTRDETNPAETHSASPVLPGSGA